MKILHINSYYNGSGFYKNIFDYQRISNEIAVYCHLPKNAEVNINDEVIIGKPYYSYEKFFYYKKHRKIWKDLNEKIDLKQFEMVHAHSLFSNGYEAYRLYLENKTPYVVSIRNTDVNVFYKYFCFLRPLANKILLNASAIIFLSSTYRDYVIKKYVPKSIKKNIEEKSYVIPNGIDKYWIENRSTHSRNSETIRVISAGVIDKNKNHIIICKSLANLIKNGYNVSFDIYGKIKDSKILNKIKKYSFANHHLNIPKEELIKKYRDADVFALLSKNETFGLVYAEAMSQGLPVIYTRGQGFDGQYKDGEIGFSVDSDDVNKLSKAILDCWNNYSLLSKNAFERSVNYDWNKINKIMIDIYKNIRRI